MSLAYSVIIPNLHSPRIGEVVEALRRQEGVDAPFEIIIIGQDKFGRVETQKAQDERVVFLESEKKLNPAEARNRGIEAARGEIILFIDADCIARPDWMANLLKAHAQGNRAVGGAMEFDGRDGFWTLCDNIAHFNNHHYSNEARVFTTVPLLTASMCVSKKACLEIGMFNERFARGQDFDFCMKLRRLGLDLYFEPAAVVRHRPTRDSLATLIKHTSSWAPFSVRIRQEYADLLQTPWFLKKAWSAFALSPLIAAAVTWRCFAKHPPLLKYLHTAPIVFFDKMAWCYFVSKELKNGRLKQIFEREVTPVTHL